MREWGQQEREGKESKERAISGKFQTQPDSWGVYITALFALLVAKSQATLWGCMLPGTSGF